MFEIRANSYFYCKTKLFLISFVCEVTWKKNFIEYYIFDFNIKPGEELIRSKSLYGRKIKNVTKKHNSQEIVN
jgi:hypothetical protein